MKPVKGFPGVYAVEVYEALAWAYDVEKNTHWYKYKDGKKDPENIYRFKRRGTKDTKGYYRYRVWLGLSMAIAYADYSGNWDKTGGGLARKIEEKNLAKEREKLEQSRKKRKKEQKESVEKQKQEIRKKSMKPKA